MVRTLEKCLNVTNPMIKHRVTYLSMIKGDSYHAGEGLAGLYRRYLQHQRVGGMGTRDDFKLTWDTLHHTMVVASMPAAAQQELYRTFKSYEFTGNDLLEFCENWDTSQTSISTSNKSVTGEASRKCSNCGSSSHKASQCPSPPLTCSFCEGTRYNKLVLAEYQRG